MDEKKHIPVLLHEVIEGLNIKGGSVVVDGTLNTGGHSKEICKIIGKSGHLIGIDRDAEALAVAKEILKDVESKVSFVEGDYRNMDVHVASVGVENADAVLLDIGLSSRQLDVAERGFTFQKDQPLLMTFESDSDKAIHTAYDIVNNWKKENIISIIEGFGDERFAYRIACEIVKARELSEIKTTFELAKIVENAVPRAYKRGRVHPATKTFQAIRIAVNDEFGALHEGIDKAIQLLRVGGRIVVISFHSGEDRIVKRAFREAEKNNNIKIITKRPIIPTDEEIEVNKRARSSKMRIAEKKEYE